jgi:hypothetical protein
MPLIPDDDLEDLKRSIDLAAVIRSRGVPRTPDGPSPTEPGLTGGPVIQMMSWIEVPPEWLERAIPLVDDPEEDAPCQ